ncbi:putative Short-chain dehydrogenase [Mycena sanguinolenta]|uniref:Putative Short-chain dehydrogenase n=1 Tax=Mycena sanguinolenta TaxID=230812 RepID=A0A8H6XND1_9AGAR|nr:putative Short-chain dehydrogenase [Mycena sanguinolenta]
MSQWSQFFPPKPHFTLESVGSQDGKVFIVTGATSGLGFELAKMLYRRNGRVYITARSNEKGEKAINAIRSAVPDSSGSLSFLHLELDDLSGIKSSVEVFKTQESKLHVLFNNAGVSQPPLGSASKQGIELQLATNCLGPFLFTQLLLPLLEATAKDSSRGSVRVVWTGSQIVELSAPPSGLVMAEVHNPPKDKTRNYVNSKTGNMFLASELARRSKDVVSVSLNPGAANTNLFRHTRLLGVFARPLMYSPNLAAHTELFAGLSGEITLEQNGCYVVPFGRISKDVRKDLVEAMKGGDEGGTGRAKEFWEWCEMMTGKYV